MKRLSYLGHKLGINYDGKTNEVSPSELNGYVLVRDIFTNPDLRQEYKNNLREYNSLRTNQSLTEEYFMKNEERRKISDKEEWSSLLRFAIGEFVGLPLALIGVFSYISNKSKNSKKN